MEDLEAARRIIGLPETVVCDHGITVLAYLDTDGEPTFGFHTHGTPKLDQTLGLLRLLEHRLIDLTVEDNE